MEETEDKHAEKAWEYPIHQAYLCTPLCSHPIYLPYQPPAKLTCNLCSCGAANICLMLTTLLLHASVKAQETPGLLPQHFPSTHFTPPVPHMNNTSSESLHGVNESIASRASETLMVAPAPLACAPLATRCPQCRVMNYGSPSLALFCRVTTLEGDCMRFSAAWPIFMPIHCCDVKWPPLQAALKHGDALTCVNTLTKADLTGTFMHACVNKSPAEYSMMVKAVRRCSRTLLGRHSQWRSSSGPGMRHLSLPRGRRREALHAWWPPAVQGQCTTLLPLTHGAFVTDTMSFHHN